MDEEKKKVQFAEQEPLPKGNMDKNYGAQIKDEIL